MNIRTRIFVGIILIVSMGFFYLLKWVVDDLRPRYLEAMEESMVDMAVMMASVAAECSTGQSLELDSFEAIFERIQQAQLNATIYDLKKSRVDIRVYITDCNGVVQFDSDSGRAEGQNYSDWNDVYLTLQGQYGARSTRIDAEDASTSILYVAAPIMRYGKLLGVLTVCKPTVTSNLFIKAAKNKIITAGILAGLAVVLLGLATTLWITRPIHQLTQYARKVRDGEKAILPTVSDHDMQIMGKAMEEMRQALEGREYVEHYVQTLTHELKGPLSAVRGAVELLYEEMPRKQQCHFLENIESETIRIQQIVDRLLLLASLEKQDEPQNMHTCNLVTIVHDVVAGIQPVLVKKNINLQVKMPESLSINGDSFLLYQVISNLLNNALDFTPSAGSICIRGECTEGEVLFHLTDTGTGIPEYALPRIFERFYSLPRPATGRKSSGLGLSIVKRILELHHASIDIRNGRETGVDITIKMSCKRQK